MTIPACISTMRRLQARIGFNNVLIGRDCAEVVRLYRRFDRQEYAEAFVDGQIFVSSLGKCRVTECGKRRDSGEGMVVTGLIHPSQQDYEARMRRAGYDPRIAKDWIIYGNAMGDSIRDAWLLCLATEDSDAGSKFGPYLVEVFEPWTLFEAITARLLADRLATQCLAGFVDYRDRNFDNPELDEIPPPFLKPPGFKDEKEFRFAWTHDDTIEMIPRVLHIPDSVGCSRIVSGG